MWQSTRLISTRCWSKGEVSKKKRISVKINHLSICTEKTGRIQPAFSSLVASPEPWGCSKFPVSWWEVQVKSAVATQCWVSEMCPLHIGLGTQQCPGWWSENCLQLKHHHYQCPGLLVSSKVLYLLSNPKFAFFFSGKISQIFQLWTAILDPSKNWKLLAFPHLLAFELKETWFGCPDPGGVQKPYWMWRWAAWAGASFSEWQPCQWKGCSNKMIFEVPSNSHHSMILSFVLLLTLAPKYSMAIFCPS